MDLDVFPSSGKGVWQTEGEKGNLSSTIMLTKKNLSLLSVHSEAAVNYGNLWKPKEAFLLGLVETLGTQ